MTITASLYKSVYYSGDTVCGDISISNGLTTAETIYISGFIQTTPGNASTIIDLGEITYSITNNTLPTYFAFPITYSGSLSSSYPIFINVAVEATTPTPAQDVASTSTTAVFSSATPPLLDIQSHGVGFLTSANTSNAYSLNIKEDAKVIGFYPVGSLYFSINSTNPSAYFGGTWELFGPGRTIKGVSDYPMLGETDSEITDGEKTHQLTINEMPAHTHQYRNRTNATSGSGRLRMHSWGLGASTAQPGLATDYVGGDQPHNNMQPYVTCYIWKRTG